jgi:predicted membrane channel-forming protein YqfA (hemolysin III family)
MRTLFAALDGVTGLLLLGGVWLGLPLRDWRVDAPATVLALLYLATAMGLFFHWSWAHRVARWVCAVSLALGLLAVMLLIASVSFLAGVNGSLGTGGMVIAVLVIALLVPYLIALPLAQLRWLRAQ